MLEVNTFCEGLYRGERHSLLWDLCSSCRMTIDHIFVLSQHILVCTSTGHQNYMLEERISYNVYSLCALELLLQNIYGAPQPFRHERILNACICYIFNCLQIFCSIYRKNAIYSSASELNKDFSKALILHNVFCTLHCCSRGIKAFIIYNHHARSHICSFHKIL